MCWSRIQILLALAAIAGIGYCVFEYYQTAKSGKNIDDALLTCDPPKAAYSYLDAFILHNLRFMCKTSTSSSYFSVFLAEHQRFKSWVLTVICYRAEGERSRGTALLLVP